MHKKPQSSRSGPASQPLRLGFVPLTDCAPLAMAKELGLFLKHGLRVELNHSHIVATLARPEYVGVPVKALEPGLSGDLDFGQGNIRRVVDFNVIHALDANEPSAEKAAWVLRHLRQTGRVRDTSTLNPSLGRRVFRADLFHNAVRLGHSSTDTVAQTNDHPSETNYILT